MKILILSKYAQIYREEIEAAQPEAEILLPGDADAEEAEIALGEPIPLRENLPRLKNLRWAQCTWAGIEPLLESGLRRDYFLTNARGVFGGLMSEYIFGYLLARERKILQRWQAQREKRWDSSLTGTLRGKTLGLLGVGSIGAALAQTAKFFGMRVRGFTRASESCPQVDEYVHPPLSASFAEGLDYLVNVLPGTPGTRRLVDTALLAALPARAVFINVGRGSALDESALVNALEAGTLSGAVLDVTGQEPLPAENRLWGVKNLLLTFHTSAPSFPKELAQMFLENYRRYLAGEALQHVVDFEKGY